MKPLIRIGINSIFSGLNFNIIPVIKCANSCIIANNIIIEYISICFVNKNNIKIANILISILNFKFFLL